MPVQHELFAAIAEEADIFPVVEVAVFQAQAMSGVQRMGEGSAPERSVLIASDVGIEQAGEIDFSALPVLSGPGEFAGESFVQGLMPGQADGLALFIAAGTRRASEVAERTDAARESGFSVLEIEDELMFRDICVEVLERRIAHPAQVADEAVAPAGWQDWPGWRDTRIGADLFLVHTASQLRGAQRESQADFPGSRAEGLFRGCHSGGQVVSGEAIVSARLKAGVQHEVSAGEEGRVFQVYLGEVVAAREEFGGQGEAAEGEEVGGALIDVAIVSAGQFDAVVGDAFGRLLLAAFRAELADQFPDGRWWVEAFEDMLEQGFRFFGQSHAALDDGEVQPGARVFFLLGDDGFEGGACFFDVSFAQQAQRVLVDVIVSVIVSCCQRGWRTDRQQAEDGAARQISEVPVDHRGT